MKPEKTRKSYCVNARGIPPAAYQVHCTCYAVPVGGTPHPVLTWGGGVIPILTWDGVTPLLTWDGGNPPPSRMGYPRQEGWGYPPVNWMEVSSSQNVNRQTPVKTVPSVILRMRTVTNSSAHFVLGMLIRCLN